MWTAFSKASVQFVHSGLAHSEATEHNNSSVQAIIRKWKHSKDYYLTFLAPHPTQWTFFQSKFPVTVVYEEWKEVEFFFHTKMLLGNLPDNMKTVPAIKTLISTLILTCNDFWWPSYQRCSWASTSLCPVDPCALKTADLPRHQHPETNTTSSYLLTQTHTHKYTSFTLFSFFSLTWTHVCLQSYALFFGLICVWWFCQTVTACVWKYTLCRQLYIKYKATERFMIYDAVLTVQS